MRLCSRSRRSRMHSIEATQPIPHQTVQWRSLAALLLERVRQWLMLSLEGCGVFIK